MANRFCDRVPFEVDPRQSELAILLETNVAGEGIFEEGGKTVSDFGDIAITTGDGDARVFASVVDSHRHPKQALPTDLGIGNRKKIVGFAIGVQ